MNNLGVWSVSLGLASPHGLFSLAFVDVEKGGPEKVISYPVLCSVCSVRPVQVGLASLAGVFCDLWQSWLGFSALRIKNPAA